MDDLIGAMGLGVEEPAVSGLDDAESKREELEPGGKESGQSLPSPAHKTYVSENYERGENRNNVKQLSDWHKSVADFALLNPTAKVKEIAEHFGVSASWLSTLTHTDAYRAYFADRLHEHQQMVSQEIISQAGDVTKLGLKRMQEKLENTPITDVSMRDLVSATELGGKMIGLGLSGGQGGGNAPVTVNLGLGVDPGMLAAARAKMVEVGHRNSAERDDLVAGALEDDTADDSELIEWRDVDEDDPA